MKPAAGEAPGEHGLLTLIYELIDAHGDTVELRLERAGELRWEAHLDYLRALQRTTREIVAHFEPLYEAASEPGGPR